MERIEDLPVIPNNELPRLIADTESQWSRGSFEIGGKNIKHIRELYLRQWTVVLGEASQRGFRVTLRQFASLAGGDNPERLPLVTYDMGRVGGVYERAGFDFFGPKDPSEAEDLSTASYFVKEKGEDLPEVEDPFTVFSRDYTRRLRVLDLVVSGADEKEKRSVVAFLGEKVLAVSADDIYLTILELHKKRGAERIYDIEAEIQERVLKFFRDKPELRTRENRIAWLTTELQSLTNPPSTSDGKYNY